MDYPQDAPQGARGSAQSFSYGEVIREAFRISWRNKFLWFFGFFAAGGLSSFSNASNLPGDFTQPGAGARIPAFVQENLVALIAVAVVVGLLVALAVIFLSILSNGALASSVAALDRGGERRFGDTWRAGLSFFWRVLLQGILFFLIGFGLALAILIVCALPIVLTFVLTESVTARVLVAVLLGLLGFLSFLAVFIPLSVIFPLALREMVVGGGPVAGSISTAFGLFRRNLGRSLLLWLISVALSIAIGIGTLLIYLLVGAILLGPAVGLFFAEYGTAAIVAGVIGGLLFLIPYALVTGAVGAFRHAYWTIAYLRLTSHEGREATTANTAPEAPA